MQIHHWFTTDQIISRYIVIEVNGIGSFDFTAISESNRGPFVDDAKLPFFRWHFGQRIRTTLCCNDSWCRQCRHDARKNHNSIHNSSLTQRAVAVILCEANFTCEWVEKNRHNMWALIYSKTTGFAVYENDIKVTSESFKWHASLLTFIIKWKNSKSFFCQWHRSSQGRAR